MVDSLANKEELKGYQFNGFFLDIRKKELSYEKFILKLETWDFEILQCLIEKSPNIAKNEEIRRIFNGNPSVKKAKHFTEKSISRLRGQFNFIKENYKENSESLNHLVIETRTNEGYCLHADVIKIYDRPTPILPEIEAETFVSENVLPSTEKSDLIFLRRKLRWPLLLLLLGVLFSAYYYRERKEPPLPTAIQIKEANITLDLDNGGWRELTESERESNEPQSKAITLIDYTLEKLSPVDNFEARLGVTKGRPPELDNFTQFPRSGEPENLTDWFNRCNRTESYQLYKFYIGNKAVNSTFQLTYKVNTFNAHNDPVKENHSQVIIYPTQNLSIRIVLPKNKPFVPDGITYQRKKICDEHFEPQNPPKLELTEKSLDQYAIQDSQGREVVWFIKEPKLGYIYRIEWNWQSEQSPHE